MNARAAAASVRSQLADAGVPDAQFEAELLVRRVTGLSRAEFFAGARFHCAAQDQLAALTERRLAREPLAYLTGTREFYRLEFAVGRGVLIPRPETELLVDIVLEELAKSPGATVLDVGTGSGCIATAIAVHAAQGRVIATEVSDSAMQIARHNVASHHVQVGIVRCDLASAIGGADVVVANLPYIPTATIPTLEPEVREWEPVSALDGGEEGLDLVRRLIEDCAERLRPRLLALEVMAGQADDVSRFAQARGGMVTIRRDLAGIDRVVMARWA